MIERLFDRRVTLIPRTSSGEDAHGNDVVVDGDPIENVPAGRDPLALEEETGDGSEIQSSTFVYFLPVEHEGISLALTGFDRIIDGTETFEVRGPVDEVVARRRGKVHHLEAVAYWQG